MTTSWYVLRSKPRKEEALWRQAMLRDFEVFYPRLHVRPTNPRARKIQPFFPGYMFVHVDLKEVGQTAFQFMPHSRGLVRFGPEPAYVPDSLILGIKRRMQELVEVGGELFFGLKKGDPVEIRDGLFEGYEAIFEDRVSGNDRVRILLRMLNGRNLPVELRAAQLARKR